MLKVDGFFELLRFQQVADTVLASLCAPAIAKIIPHLEVQILLLVFCNYFHYMVLNKPMCICI